MNKILLSAAVAGSFVATAASAQSIPAAVVAVVDLDKVVSQCTACVAANTALRSRAAALQSREQTLAAPLEAEQKSIQAAIDALPKGKEPDAALQARIRAFQSKQQAGAQELERGRQQIQRDQQYIGEQIRAKLGPIYQQVMQRRGANVMVESGATLATSANVDVTNDVLAALNAALPSVQTTAPAQPQQQPQGR
jgi:Skp family chaperone for outer membrane proteins